MQILHFSILAPPAMPFFNTLPSKNNMGGWCLFTAVPKGRLLLTYLNTEELVLGSNTLKALKQNFRRVKIKTTKSRLSFPSAGCFQLLFVYSCSKRTPFARLPEHTRACFREQYTFNLCTSSVREH